MTALTYEPAAVGGGLLLAAGSRMLLLTASPDPAQRDAVWVALGGPVGFQGALDALTSAGLAATPPFVLIDDADGTLRVIVRGDMTVRVSGPDGQERVTGAGVSTWAERSIAGAVSATVEFAGSKLMEGVSPLALVAGQAWVGRAVLAVGEAALVPGSVPEVAPVSTPSLPGAAPAAEVMADAPASVTAQAVPGPPEPGPESVPAVTPLPVPAVAAVAELAEGASEQSPTGVDIEATRVDTLNESSLPEPSADSPSSEQAVTAIDAVVAKFTSLQDYAELQRSPFQVLGAPGFVIEGSFIDPRAGTLFQGVMLAAVDRGPCVDLVQITGTASAEQARQMWPVVREIINSISFAGS